MTFFTASTFIFDPIKITPNIRSSNKYERLHLQELCNEADHRLFNKILESQYHILEQLLLPTFPQS